MSCLDKKICIITIHDVSAFQDNLSKVIQTMNQIEDPDVKYDIAIIHFSKIFLETIIPDVYIWDFV